MRHPQTDEGAAAGRRHVVDGRDDLVDEPVLPRLLRAEPPVAPRVPLDRLDRLPGVLGDQGEHGVAGVAQVLGLDLDVHGRAADARGSLVQQDPRVRQGMPLARRPGRQQELPGTRGHPHRQRGHVVGDQPHHVADRQHRRHRSAGGVDPEADVGAVVLGREQQQLVHQPVAVALLEGLAEHHDALVHQPGGSARRRAGSWSSCAHGDRSRTATEGRAALSRSAWADPPAAERSVSPPAAS